MIVAAAAAAAAESLCSISGWLKCCTMTWAYLADSASRLTLNTSNFLQHKCCCCCLYSLLNCWSFAAAVAVVVAAATDEFVEK